MAKAKLKTEKTEASVKGFLETLKDSQKKSDSLIVLDMMQKAMGEKPKMWGTSIIGFGSVYLKYASGRELDWFKMGFSPRKQSLTLYIINSSQEQKELLKKLGKHSTGKGCLYINKLADVDTGVLEKIIQQSAERKKK
jgi:hypothetical protein